MVVLQALSSELTENLREQRRDLQARQRSRAAVLHAGHLRPWAPLPPVGAPRALQAWPLLNNPCAPYSWERRKLTRPAAPLHRMALVTIQSRNCCSSGPAPHNRTSWMRPAALWMRPLWRLGAASCSR